MIYETAKFFYSNNKDIHITLRSGRWCNGKILKLDKDKLILLEEKLGEILVLFDRIVDDGIVPREVK